MQAILLALIVSLLTVAGQTLWKIGLSARGTEPGVLQLVSLFFSPTVFSGTLLYGAATAVWFYMLPRYNLSYVYPLMSITYIISLVIAFLIFKEQIPLSRWTGVLVIGLGIYMVTKS